MGAVPGVGVVGEVRSASYQKGQIFNRPKKAFDGWVLFLVEYQYQDAYNQLYPEFEINPLYVSKPTGFGIEIPAVEGRPWPDATRLFYSAGKVRLVPKEAQYDFAATSDTPVEWKSQQIYDRLDITGTNRVVGNVIGFKLKDLRNVAQGNDYSVEFSYGREHYYNNIDNAQKVAVGVGLTGFASPLLLTNISMQLADDFVTIVEPSSLYLSVARKLYNFTLISATPAELRQVTNSTPPEIVNGQQVGAILSQSSSIVFGLDVANPENSSYSLFTIPPPPPFVPPPIGTLRTWTNTSTSYIPNSPLSPPP
jgi:hypothetical protein